MTDPTWTADEAIERRVLLQIRSFITKHGAKEVDMFCAQRLHDIRMDATHRERRLATRPPAR